MNLDEFGITKISYLGSGKWSVHTNDGKFVATFKKDTKN